MLSCLLLNAAILRPETEKNGNKPQGGGRANVLKKTKNNTTWFDYVRIFSIKIILMTSILLVVYTVILKRVSYHYYYTWLLCMKCSCRAVCPRTRPFSLHTKIRAMYVLKKVLLYGIVCIASRLTWVFFLRRFFNRAFQSHAMRNKLALLVAHRDTWSALEVRARSEKVWPLAFNIAHRCILSYLICMIV